VGLLSLIMPAVSGWDPETAKLSYGFGAGCLVAFIYVLIAGLRGQMEVRNQPRGLASERDRDKESWTSASSNFSRFTTTDWIGLVIPLILGLVIGVII
jgi:hypothetical protein